MLPIDKRPCNLNKLLSLNLSLITRAHSLNPWVFYLSAQYKGCRAVSVNRNGRFLATTCRLEEPV